MTIELPPELSDYIAAEVARGRFASESAAIAQAVRTLARVEAKRALLIADIEDGMEGEGIPADEVLAELEQLVNGKSSAAAVIR